MYAAKILTQVLLEEIYLNSASRKVVSDLSLGKFLRKDEDAYIHIECKICEVANEIIKQNPSARFWKNKT